MKVMIVESPNKTAKIADIVGPSWTVVASKGHVRDLPQRALGIRGDDYALQYEVSERRRPLIQKLKEITRQAELVVLATDPDREGEAIAWHLKDELGISESQYQRVTFNAIDAQTIKAGLAAARRIDMDLVHAQEARRAVDRLVGYKVSPLMWDAIGAGAAAGRVQSPAVRLVLDRNRAISAFRPTRHFGARVFFQNDMWAAEWVTGPYLQGDDKYVLDEGLARLAAGCGEMTVVESEVKQEREPPPAPFRTSTLQQAAFQKLRLNPSQVMSVAQSLFEGEAKDKSGHISYHRTDTVNFSEDAISALRAFAISKGYELPAKPRKFREGKDAQAGHEGIRPTYFEKEQITGSPEAQALYRLIWERALASQLNDAVYNVTTLTLEGKQQGRTFRYKAVGRVLVDSGWRVLSGAADDSDVDELESDGDVCAGSVPSLSIGERVLPQDGKLLTKMTKPPSRYTQASLVRDLERRGIGRPSTFAAIVSRVLELTYVVEEKGYLNCSPAGELVVDTLVKGGFGFIEYNFTREMEEELDSIAEGKATYSGVVSSMDRALEQDIVSIKASGAIKPRFPCPKCSRAMRRVKGSHGIFWSCSGYQSGDCKHVMDDKRGEPVEREVHDCPECKAPMRRLAGANGHFWGCSGYREGCKVTLPDVKGKPVKKPDPSKHLCPDCKKPLIRRTRPGKEGYDFFGCTGYPECKSSFGVGPKGTPVARKTK